MRKAIAFLITVFLAACGAAVIKPPDAERGREMTVRLDSFESSNGFKAFVLPDPSADIVRLELRYKVGASSDPVGKEGLAHLVEHLLFQTKLPIGGELRSTSAELTRLTLGWNAYTNYEATHYEATTTPDKLADLFALEMYRLASGCESWDEEMFLREREVVRNEIRQRSGSPFGAMSDELLEAVYPPQHPYGRPIGGTLESLASITLADACNFFETHYRPDNVYVVAVGNTTKDEIMALAKNWFVRFPKPPPQDPQVVSTAPPGNGRIIRRTVPGLEYSYLHVAWPLPPAGTPAYRRAMMGVGSVGVSAARRASTYDWGVVYGYPVGGQDAPMWVVTAQLRDPDDRDEALDAIKDAVRNATEAMTRSGRSADHNLAWTYRREYTKESILARYESIGARGSFLADAMQFDPKGRLVVGQFQELDETEPRDVRKTMEAVLDVDRAHVVFVEPGASGKRVAGEFNYHASAHGDEGWKVPVNPADAERNAIVPRQFASRLSVTEYTLPNGLRVVLWPHAELPLVRTSLVVRAGRGADPEGRDGLASMASLNGSVSQDVAVFRSRDLATELQDTIKRASMALRRDARGTYDEWQDRKKRDLLRDSSARNARYRSDLRQALYGANHPYSRGVVTLDTLRKINADPIDDFRDKYYKPANATLIVVGQFDEELVRKHIEYNFAHLSAGTRQDYDLPPARSLDEIVLVEGVDNTLATLSVDMRWPGGTGRDQYAARQVLAGVLDAKLSSLREELAVTYGAGAFYSPNRGPGAWRIGAQVDPARADEAMRAIQSLLVEMRADPESYKAEFVLARRALVYSLLTGASSPGSTLRELEVAAEFELASNWAESLASDVASLRVDDLHKLLITEIHPDRAVIGLFGPETAIERARAVVNAGPGRTDR